TLARTEPWSVRVSGEAQTPIAFGVRELDPLVTASGRYLMECSGNSDPSNFGLISTADWEGVPLLELLDRAKPPAGSYRILVSGLDDIAATTRTSVPGASWIFAGDRLEGALLAIRMNGAPLP